VPEDDRAFATRLACYRARNSVALARLTTDRAAKAVTHQSDKSVQRNQRYFGRAAGDERGVGNAFLDGTVARIDAATLSAWATFVG
jgi:hypothetical protein